MTQRRKTPRIGTEIPVTFQFKGRNVKATCKDIGLGGVRIYSDVLAPVGTRLVLQISFNRNLCFMGFTGLVVATKERVGVGFHQPYEMGLQFNNVGEIEEKVLDTCIAEVIQIQRLQPSEANVSLEEKNISVLVTDRPINASQFTRPLVLEERLLPKD